MLATSLRQHNISAQTPVRAQGFGVRFADAPPTFIADTKEDNKKKKKNKRSSQTK